MYKFSYSRNGMEVSYESETVHTEKVTVSTEDETWVDKLSIKERQYIQGRLDKEGYRDDENLQHIGNKVCEIYHEMIS